MHPYYYHVGPSPEGFMFGGVLMLLLWVLVISLIVMLVRRASGHGHWHGHLEHHQEHHTDDSLEIVKARYARGEITKDEMEQMKKDLA